MLSLEKLKSGQATFPCRGLIYQAHIFDKQMLEFEKSNPYINEKGRLLTPVLCLSFFTRFFKILKKQRSI
jgi:hypothetical protein